MYHLTLSLYVSTDPLDLDRFFTFLILYTVGRTPWTGDQHIARPLRTHRTTQTHNKRTQTSMPRVGSEPTIPVFEWAKTVYASDRAATVTGTNGKTQRHKDIWKSRGTDPRILNLGTRCR
jgi:hypothetical protein